MSAFRILSLLVTPFISRILSCQQLGSDYLIVLLLPWIRVYREMLALVNSALPNAVIGLLTAGAQITLSPNIDDGVYLTVSVDQLMLSLCEQERFCIRF